jgi:site-specific recombinase XerD
MRVDGRPQLRSVQGTAVLPLAGAVIDPLVYQSSCVDGFVASQVARGFSATTIDNGTGVLERFLALAGKPAWELTAADVDAVVAALIDRGVGAVTRRDYVGTFKSFFAFLQARHAAEIESRFGIRLSDPLDVFHAGRHVTSDSPSTRPPPTPLRMEEFFAFLRERMDAARKWTPAARDYAMFRMLYHAGLRSAEAASLEIRDLHFDRGPFGKIHVRLGKAAKGSGPRPRWVPMLDDLALILHWYLEEVRPRFRVGSQVLFCDEGGGPMNSGSIRNRLATLCAAEGRPAHEQFSPHGLRHACATRNYERGVDLVAIQQMLGHWNVGTTMRYVTPSATFVEDAYRRAVSSTLAGLEEE